MSKVTKIPTLAIVLVAIGVGSLLLGLVYSTYNYRPYQNLAYPTQPQYGMMGQYRQQLSTQPQYNSPVTMDQAKSIAQQYLASTGNPNLAIKEIMEFQYNFYVIYYEKDTGRGAFEMLIWKQSPAQGLTGRGMIGWGVGAGVITPEPGPNMMWNTKYSLMRNGMMGYGSQGYSTMTISEDQAQGLAQAYLDAHFQDAKTEMATQFYGYYTFDFTVNGKIAGMLSVNGFTGDVWYHSWHGNFIQEIEFD
jgi:hypothetical protein